MWPTLLGWVWRRESCRSLPFACLESLPQISGFTLGTIILSQLTGRGHFPAFVSTFRRWAFTASVCWLCQPVFRRRLHPCARSRQALIERFRQVNHPDFRLVGHLFPLNRWWVVPHNHYRLIKTLWLQSPVSFYGRDCGVRSCRIRLAQVLTVFKFAPIWVRIFIINSSLEGVASLAFASSISRSSSSSVAVRFAIIVNDFCGQPFNSVSRTQLNSISRTLSHVTS